MSLFIHHCIKCLQQNKQINRKIQTATDKQFQEMLRVLINEHQWIQKDLKIHHQNKTHTFM